MGSPVSAWRSTALSGSLPVELSIAAGSGAKVVLIRDLRERRRREFEARGWLERKTPYRHSVGHSYRGGVPIEPYLTDQWYVKVTDDSLKGSA
ncbi:MAG TPA: class I tRNA ligase family protein, partial [Polyangiaceae bacterium]|nr:class I tRNA ligase family protein [Polyangiaceae bacterium]